MQEVQSVKPQYKISYMSCKQRNHDGQKMNIICMQKACREHSLICSLCKQSSHPHHLTRPLKFYLQQLRKNYQHSTHNFRQQIQQLETTRALFMRKMMISIEKIAEEFRQLEKDVIDRFQQLKSQIIQNETRRKKFEQFYKNLTTNKQEQPQFTIANYLPQQKVPKFNNTDSFDFVTKSVCDIVLKAKQNLFVEFANPIVKEMQLAYKGNQEIYIRPINITKEGFVFTQTSILNNNAPSLCLLTHDIRKLLGKIKVKTLQIRKNSKIVLGVSEKSYFQSLQNVWNYPSSNSIFYIASDGKNYNCSVNSIKSFTEMSQFEISYSSNQVILSSKKNSTIFNIPADKQYHFFFALVGKAKLQVIYPSA